jgi:hypothetical protein
VLIVLGTTTAFTVLDVRAGLSQAGQADPG